jgi:hypothetical protein
LAIALKWSKTLNNWQNIIVNSFLFKLYGGSQLELFHRNMENNILIMIAILDNLSEKVLLLSYLDGLTIEES